MAFIVWLSFVDGEMTVIHSDLARCTPTSAAVTGLP
jgi:hypothetical protein